MISQRYEVRPFGTFSLLCLLESKSRAHVTRDQQTDTGEKAPNILLSLE